MAPVYAKQKNFAELKIVRIVTIKLTWQTYLANLVGKRMCNMVTASLSGACRYGPNHVPDRSGPVSIA